MRPPELLRESLDRLADHHQWVQSRRLRLAVVEEVRLVRGPLELYRQPRRRQEIQKIRSEYHASPFPAPTRSGYIEKSSLKEQHLEACRDSKRHLPA